MEKYNNTIVIDFKRSISYNINSNQIDNPGGACMRFVMMSDTHYISRRMIADKQDKELMLQPAVTEAAVLQAAEDCDTLFIAGDLTDTGDIFSHEDFAAFLRTVKQSGTKIYVIFATHDFHHQKAYVRKYGEKVQYKSKPWDQPWFDIENVDWKSFVKDEYLSLPEDKLAPGLVPALSPEEVWEIYREFGPDEAYSVNEESFSYCLDLDENTRCLMLNDIFRNVEALKDQSPTYTPTCLKWIKKMYDEAQKDGKYIFICSHHPMLPAVPAHRIGAGKENRNMRSPDVGQMLADMGFNLAFTGHSHFCDVGYLKSEKGNLLWDITTPSVRFYPPAYREIEIDGKSGTVSYNCKYINATEKTEIEEKTLFEHYHNCFYNDYYRSITGAGGAVKKLMDRLTVKDIYFLVRGKAKLTKEEYNSIKNLKVFDLIIETAFNMLIGDGEYTPDTPEYKVLMSLSAKLDSVIDTQPFIDVKNKYMGGYSVSEIIEPMLFNNSVPDREGVLRLDEIPEKRLETPVYSSHFGDVLMAVIYIIALVLSPLAPVAAAIALPVMTIKKKKKSKKPQGPYYKYQ